MVLLFKVLFNRQQQITHHVNFESVKVLFSNFDNFSSQIFLDYRYTRWYLVRLGSIYSACVLPMECLSFEEFWSTPMVEVLDAETAEEPVFDSKLRSYCVYFVEIYFMYFKLY